MKTKMMDQRGGILLEGVIALMVLCLVIVSVMMMSGIVIRGHLMTKMAYQEAFELNTIRDQVVEHVKISKVNSPAGVSSTVGSVVAAHPGWRFALQSEEQSLYDLLLIHDTPLGERTYDVKIFAK